MSDKTRIAADDASVRAARALRAARRRIEDLESAGSEPIAIVGMAGRFPGGANSVEDLWERLRGGHDCIQPVPTERWRVDGFADGKGGSGLIDRGGFVDNVGGFDASFFNVSPREARQLDPQQRILLEVAVDAFGNAGISNGVLADAEVGVYVGVVNNDYLQLQLADPDAVDIYSVVGGVNCMLANRISYHLDLRGPSMAVDTACSSSLVAAHLACQSLRSGETEVALAAGVNLILSPFTTFAYTRAFPLAADGRCKTFDASADGYVRGEGCAAVVLKRLSDAQRDGDPIWAVIRGSAVNQDGRTNGLTAPNGLAQERVIRAALRNADVAPARVTVLEAHGTGTQLGDPIEVEALRSVYGSVGETELPCALGSVKTNLGHLEAASGIAGLIKLALCLNHRELPPHLHLQRVNPEVPLDGTRFFIPTKLEPWGAPDETLVGGVSAFGAGGTNAHVLVEQAPECGPRRQRCSGDDMPDILLLSAHCRPALAELATAWARAIDDAPATLADLCATAAFRTSRHAYRLAVAGTGASEVARALRSYAAGRVGDEDTVAEGLASSRRRVAFVFSGFGGQWPGMAADLIARETVFREAVSRCSKALAPYAGFDVERELEGSATSSAGTDRVQPMLWSVQIALAELWQSWGVQPDAVVGHSMGELAAAAVSGALELEEAARVICIRSQVLRELAGGGQMLFVADTADAVEARLGALPGDVSVAASNGPLSTVVSGEIAALDVLERSLGRDNIFARRLNAPGAGHGPMVDAILPEMKARFGIVRAKQASVPYASAAKAALVAGDELTEAYWLFHARHRVRFAETIQMMIAKGFNTFVEVGPHPILTAQIEETAVAEGGDPVVIGTIERDGKPLVDMRANLGRLAVAGIEVEWSKLYDPKGRFLRQPGYPWQRRTYWFRSDTNYRLPEAAPNAESIGKVDDDIVERLGERFGPQPPVLESLRTTVARKRPGVVHAYVRERVAEALGHAAADIDGDTGFFQMGMNSFMTVQLRERLKADTGVAITTTTILEYSTVARLAGYLASAMEPLCAEENTETSSHQVREVEGDHGLGQLRALSDAELVERLARELDAESVPRVGSSH